MSPPYKGHNNQWLTKILFQEMHREIAVDRRACEAVFSFNNDIPGLINARKTFVELMDVTGYDWAIKYLHSWDHFERLLESEWFVPEYENWCNEIHANLKSKALKRIAEIATSESNEAQALAASKYLAEKGWERSRRGRPSSADVKGELKRISDLHGTTEGDMKRIGLTVITGDKR